MLPANMVYILILLIFLIIFYYVIKYIKKLNENKKKWSIDTITNSEENQVINNDNSNINDYSHKNNGQVNYKNYYKPKRYITTLNELNFYNILLDIAKELDMILFAQVSLYNIVSMKENLDYSTKTKYFNKIASKSIDFVLVDKNNCRIKLCIELDDSTHKKQRRIERDNFINELFKQLEINFLRYPIYKVYYKEALKKRIQEEMKEHYYIK